ncbi:MAG: hypothetical protein KatS3mg105_0218 [Gemmatales bacterium]|nr:MAG: hypothetical protein KatS3mg105_0218 [Gemmatales bacterium]
MSARWQKQYGTKNWLLLALMAGLAVLGGVLVPQLRLHSPDANAQPSFVSKSSADGKLGYTPPAIPAAPDPQGMILRLFLFAAVLLAMTVLGLVLARKWLTINPATATGQNKSMRLVEMLPLGNRCCLYLVDADQRPVLVGVDASGLRTIVPIPESFGRELQGLHERTNSYSAALPDGESISGGV